VPVASSRKISPTGSAPFKLFKTLDSINPHRRFSRRSPSPRPTARLKLCLQGLERNRPWAFGLLRHVAQDRAHQHRSLEALLTLHLCLISGAKREISSKVIEIIEMHFVFECACILDDFHLDQSQFSGPVPELRTPEPTDGCIDLMCWSQLKLTMSLELHEQRHTQVLQHG
jgi:hypothetical protein